MCIGAWTLEHPDYALILCTNRDEFLDRPTQNAHFHSFSNADPIPDISSISSGQILSGRDVQAGGSWFGVNRAGRIALLTNITEPAKRYNTSRGSLVSTFLLSESSHPLEDEIGKIVAHDANYAGFNLLLLSPSLGQSGSVRYDSLLVTNHGGGGTLVSRKLQPGEKACGAMSNGIDGAGADLWPKIQQATKDFDAVLQALPPDARESELIEHLFHLLAWHPQHTITERKDLRSTVQVLPVPIVLDGPSGNPIPAFYGTRLSTVVLVRKNGEIIFVERDVWETGPDGKPMKADPPTERRFEFIVNKSALNLGS